MKIIRNLKRNRFFLERGNRYTSEFEVFEEPFVENGAASRNPFFLKRDKIRSSPNFLVGSRGQINFESGIWWIIIVLSLLIGSLLFSLFWYEKIYLPGVQAKLEAKEGAAQQSAVVGSKYDVRLKPLHWDLVFPAQENRELFGNAIDLLGFRMYFQSPALVILRASAETAPKLIRAIEDSGGVLKGGGRPRSIHFPDMDEDFKISMALQAPQIKISKALTHHWHLSFELPNQFVFKSNIAASGGRFRYDSPDLWVVEISADNFQALKEIARNTHGLTVNFGDRGEVSTEGYKRIPVTLSLYVEKG